MNAYNKYGFQLDILRLIFLKGKNEGRCSSCQSITKTKNGLVVLKNISKLIDSSKAMIPLEVFKRYGFTQPLCEKCFNEKYEQLKCDLNEASKESIKVKIYDVKDNLPIDVEYGEEFIYITDTWGSNKEEDGEKLLSSFMADLKQYAAWKKYDCVILKNKENYSFFSDLGNKRFKFECVLSKTKQ